MNKLAPSGPCTCFELNNDELSLVRGGNVVYACGSVDKEASAKGSDVNSLLEELFKI